MGHNLKKSNRQFGHMQVIQWSRKKNEIYVASDPSGQEKNLTDVY